MQVFYNDKHPMHHGRQEMFRGQLVPCVEVPARVDHVLRELQSRRLGTVAAPPELAAGVLERVHAPRYLQFLRGAWDGWVALDPANAQRDAVPSYWPIRSFRSDVLPSNFHARMGLFSFDAGSPLTAGTWAAAREGAACASRRRPQPAGGRAQRLCADAAARAPCRPRLLRRLLLPQQRRGRGAGACRDGGVERVAVLDIDYHHGNGTQSIFYERGDVFFASVHGDPDTEYPYYLGYADELGAGAGLGCNLNLPLPRGTGFARWREALALALDGIARFDAQALVVSLGVDTFEKDPISGFGLRSDDYLQVGEDLAAAGLPTLFVFEGGYAVAEVGVNAVNVLQGFAQRAN